MSARSRREQVAKLTSDGLSSQRIATRLGVTLRTVNKDRCILGITLTPQQRAAAYAAGYHERRKAVTTLTREGWTTRQIADHLRVSTRTVQRDRVATGVAQSRAPLFTDDEHRRALAMITDGASISEVARTMGRNVDTIWRRFKGMGWTSDQTGAYNSLRSKLGRLLDE